MAICVKCRKELPDGALYCLYCGESQQPQKRGRRSRGNGEGSVYRRKNGSYIAVKILGYETDDTTGKKAKEGYANRNNDCDRRKRII